jgi:hypothetical protein
MDKFVVPDRTNLHLGVFVLEWFALSEEGIRESIG